MYIDQQVLQGITEGKNYSFAIYESENTVVVLGRSCRGEEDVHVERCIRDNIPILRRLGGGGTVLLTRGILIISVAGKSPVPFQLREHMNSVNYLIMKALEGFGVKNLNIKGISDVATGNKKIMGSSLYRKKELVLYQGALLLNPDMKIFDKYLKHPRREPDYRAGRKHKDFLTSLYSEGYRIEKENLIDKIKLIFQECPPWAGLIPQY